MSAIITLTTDFGLTDAYVAAMKEGNAFEAKSMVLRNQTPVLAAFGGAGIPGNLYRLV